MITEERISAFLRSLERPKAKILEEIRQEAVSSGVPVIRGETEPLLTFFTDLLKPMHILEVGCAVGYSSLLMAESLPVGGHITTLENYPPRIEKAGENFKRAGKEDVITLISGDAGETLKELEGPYEFIFMDAAKGQYLNWLPEVLRLLSPGGVLVSDNVLQDGDVLESRFAVERRDRTIYDRMREYLRELKNREELSTMVLPLGDGVAVTLKKE